MRHAIRPLIAAVILGLATGPMAIAAGPPDLTTLGPGETIDLRQELPVNLVFVGYEPGPGPANVDEARFRAGLPSTYDTVNRSPLFYGLESDAHVGFEYDYNVVWSGSAFEDAFFGYLGSIATPAPLTVFQTDYNAQLHNGLDVTDNSYIDAPSVERWLAHNAGPMLGIDTTEYTVFLVNWYGRPDFRFHLYTKTDEPDPDTGYNFGVERQSRKLIAWGGTTPDDEESGLGSLHRIWFYDLSAGPESWTDNWNVDDADVDGDDVLDYRMPPVWEYGNLSGYRPFDDLSGDLAKVVRYVALDLLFTTSPLYKPALSAPALPSSVQVDITAFDRVGIDEASLFDRGLITQELAELKPDSSFTTELSGQTLDGKVAAVYDCFIADVTCYGGRMFRIAFADLYLYFQDHILGYLEGDADYELGVFAFYAADQAWLAGFADDNWRDGTQSYVFAFDDPASQALGYGFTTTVIHEVGHHLGMSHPHDGYDSETGLDFWQSGDFYFAWSGDESNTIMSYLDVNFDFSQFDRDNMSRYMTAVYLNTANSVLAKIYASPRADSIASWLLAADASAAAALAAYDEHDWATAAVQSRTAYDTVMSAAASINVQVEPQASSADVKAHGRSYPFVDPVDGHRGRP